MIDSMQALYDHVNHYRGYARYQGIEGELHIYGGSRVSLHYDTRARRHNVVPIPDAALADDADPRLELRTLDGSWVPLSGYDDAAVAARIERFGALHNFETAVQNYEFARTRLAEAAEQLHPDDRGNFTLPDLPTVHAPTDEYRDAI